MYLPHELGNAIGRAARAEILLFTTYILNRFDRDNLREEGIENSSSTRLVLMFVPYTVKGDRHYCRSYKRDNVSKVNQRVVSKCKG